MYLVLFFSRQCGVIAVLEVVTEAFCLVWWRAARGGPLAHTPPSDLEVYVSRLPALHHVALSCRCKPQNSSAETLPRHETSALQQG